MISSVSVEGYQADSYCMVRVFSIFEDDTGGPMQINKSDKLPLLEKVLAGGYIAAMATYMVSESVFTLSLLSVTLLALVLLLREAWK
jgi:hypothetical protein